MIGRCKDGAFEMPMDGGDVDPREDHASTARRGQATIDFAGTSAQQPNNFNAPGSVTEAAVLYVFRCLVDSDIPMNAGCLKPLDIVVPEGSLLSPRPPGAVAGRQRRDQPGGGRRAVRGAGRAGGDRRAR